jgi:Lon protease-like protein
MFPLGAVLLPTMVLPLHIFEPRYRQLISDCLEGDSEFGVCLIERGSEVGGGEVRTNVGCVAQIVDAQEFPDGRWAVAAVGTRRIRILSWQPDNPYPVADVEDWSDHAPTADLGATRDLVVDQLRTVLSLQHELVIAGPDVDTHIDADPIIAGYQIAGLSPLGPFDRQQLLGAEDPGLRFHQLEVLLSDSESDLRRQLDLR